MKVAITSSGNSLESKIDQRFGRCEYFVIYDTETGDVEIIPNSSKDISEGAGPASVQFVAALDVKKIISGEFGIKVKALLDSLKVQMIILKDSEKTIREVIKMLKN